MIGQERSAVPINRQTEQLDANRQAVADDIAKAVHASIATTAMQCVVGLLDTMRAIATGDEDAMLPLLIFRNPELIGKREIYRARLSEIEHIIERASQCLTDAMDCDDQDATA